MKRSSAMIFLWVILTLTMFVPLAFGVFMLLSKP